MWLLNLVTPCLLLTLTPASLHSLPQLNNARLRMALLPQDGEWVGEQPGRVGGLPLAAKSGWAGLGSTMAQQHCAVPSHSTQH